MACYRLSAITYSLIYIGEVPLFNGDISRTCSINSRLRSTREPTFPAWQHKRPSRFLISVDFFCGPLIRLSYMTMVKMALPCQYGCDRLSCSHIYLITRTSRARLKSARSTLEFLSSIKEKFFMFSHFTHWLLAKKST